MATPGRREPRCLTMAIFGTPDDRDVFFIPNATPDAALSAGFNVWFVFFGQFFDHGLDLVDKGARHGLHSAAAG